MAWTTHSIKLAAAQSIFIGCEITPMEFGGKIVGYRAQCGPMTVEDTGLTELCKQLWALAFSALQRAGKG